MAGLSPASRVYPLAAAYTRGPGVAEALRRPAWRNTVRNQARSSGQAWRWCRSDRI